MSLEKAKEQSTDTSVGLGQLSIDDMEVDATSPIVIYDDSDNDDDDGCIPMVLLISMLKRLTEAKVLVLVSPLPKVWNGTLLLIPTEKRTDPSAPPPIDPSKAELKTIENA